MISDNIWADNIFSSYQRTLGYLALYQSSLFRPRFRPPYIFICNTATPTYIITHSTIVYRQNPTPRFAKILSSILISFSHVKSSWVLSVNSSNCYKPFSKFKINRFLSLSSFLYKNIFLSRLKTICSWKFPELVVWETCKWRTTMGNHQHVQCWREFSSL